MFMIKDQDTGINWLKCVGNVYDIRNTDKMA